jgi:tetratricopeptide (TPR) repeat protein
MEIPTESYAVVLSLRALMAKQYEESHALLRWAHEDYQPKGEFLKRIKALFRADLSARERPELDVAIAASAAVTGRLDAREIAHAEQILSAASAVEPLDPERKTALSYARARLLLNESPEQAARAFGALYEASSEDEELWTQYAGSLLVARRFDELVPILKRRVQGRPDRDPTWQGLTFAEVESGQFAAALERVQSRRSVGVATDTELNKVAWASLFVSGDLALAAELAGAALQIRESSKGDGVKAILNTLAVLRAEVGDYAEAHGFFLRSIEGNRSPKLGPADWYALGRIAEGLGLGADAEAAYARIPEPKPNASFDVWTLAETRRRRAGL